MSQTEQWHETFDRAVGLAEYIEEHAEYVEKHHSADSVTLGSVKRAAEKLAACVLWLSEHMSDLTEVQQ